MNSLETEGLRNSGGSVDKHHSHFQPRDRKTGRYAGGPVYPEHREDTEHRQGRPRLASSDMAMQYADGGSAVRFLSRMFGRAAPAAEKATKAPVSQGTRDLYALERPRDRYGDTYQGIDDVRHGTRKTGRAGDMLRAEDEMRAMDLGSATRHADGGAAGKGARYPYYAPDYGNSPVTNDLVFAQRKQEGGAVAGAIRGPDGGRDDTRPIDVESGSFVVPAETVAFLGGHNTENGYRVLDNVFGRGGTARSHGGSAGRGPNVPIHISDGEYVLSPEQVAKVGGGDVERGHKLLDQMVMRLRKQHIDTLAKLPAPAKD